MKEFIDWRNMSGETYIVIEFTEYFQQGIGIANFSTREEAEACISTRLANGSCGSYNILHCSNVTKIK